MTRSSLPSGTPVEVARPAGEPVAGLVVIPDIWGLRPLFDDLCARLADERSVAVAAIEPFSGRDLPTIEDRFAAVAELRDEDTLGDIVAAADLLGTARVCCIGFCMGGMYVLKAAGLGRFDRACAFYGMIRVPESWMGSGHRQPLDYLAEAGATPTMAVIGGRDTWTPALDVAALEAAGVGVALYPEAEHGFVHDPSRETHRAGDAADAWSRCWQFLGL